MTRSMTEGFRKMIPSNPSAALAVGLIVVMIAWTVVEYTRFPMGMNFKCFGWAPWLVVLVAVALLAAALMRKK